MHFDTNIFKWLDFFPSDSHCFMSDKKTLRMTLLNFKTSEL